MVILFVGSNPSQRSTSVVPFWMDTKSGAVLDSWIKRLQVDNLEVTYANVANYPTPGNRPLKMSEIKAELDALAYRVYGFNGVNPDRVITLGKTAHIAMTLLRIHHYAMPHPSGLNRQLNDPKFVEEKIAGLKAYMSLPEL